MKREIIKELGFSVSVGMSLAKVASKHRKPDGLITISGRDIPAYLWHLPMEMIWGIGPATKEYLNKLGIPTDLEFTVIPEEARRRLNNPKVEICQELLGEKVYGVSPEEKTSYDTISNTKTFAPPTTDRDYIFVQMLINMESACINARRYQPAPAGLIYFLKKARFDTEGRETRLSRPCAHPLVISPLLQDLLNDIYQDGILYCDTGIILFHLVPNASIQYSLFEDPLHGGKRIRSLYGAMDSLSGRHGKHIIYLGASRPLEETGTGNRREPTIREQNRLYSKSRCKHLVLPIFNHAVKITGVTPTAAKPDMNGGSPSCCLNQACCECDSCVDL